MRHSPTLQHHQKLAAWILECECAAMGETLFSSSYQPNPHSALDVLAFVLTPIGAFASDPDELAAVAEILNTAKTEAIERWQSLRTRTRCS